MLTPQRRKYRETQTECVALEAGDPLVDLHCPQVDRIVVDRAWGSNRSRGSLHGDEQTPETKSSYGVPTTPFPAPWQPTGVLHRIAPPVFWSVWEVLVHSFYPTFPDEKAERNYNRVSFKFIFRDPAIQSRIDSHVQEHWSVTKPLARWSALWLIVSWALACGFATRPWVLMDEVFLYGVSPQSNCTRVYSLIEPTPGRPCFYRPGYVSLLLLCATEAEIYQFYGCV
jgi:hypothetical protein